MNIANSSTRKAMSPTTCRSLTTVDCSAVFGTKSPHDVIAPIRVAQERLTWLEHLFNCIATDSKAEPHTKRLAEMGRHVAADAADLAESVHADMLEAIKKGGAA